MTLTISEKGTSIVVEATDYLLEKTDVEIGKEFERGAFDRKVEDVQATVSNADGTFSTLFGGKPSTTRREVKIVDDFGRIDFLGEIKNKSIEFDPANETVEFSAFSRLKQFWERARTHTIQPKPRTNEGSIVYTTVKYILEREFLHSRTMQRGGGAGVNERYGDLFRSVIIDTEYQNRPIRGWANASTYVNPAIGDNGRYRELAGSAYAQNASGKTTAFDLLTAFAYYYNAEFFIDYDQNALRMARRSTIQSATPAAGAPHDLDRVLMDSEKVRVGVLDDDKYDYLRVIYYNAPPKYPTIERVELTPATTGLTKNVSYVVTDILRFYNSEIEIETPASSPIYVDVEGPLSAAPHMKSAIVYLFIPYTPFSVVKRLYRTPQGGGDFLLLREFTPGTENVSFIDTHSDAMLGLTKPPTELQSMIAWIRKNESTGAWDAPIPDTFDGANTPEGNTLNLIPQLSFKEITGSTVRPVSSNDLVAFFGLEALSSDYNSKIQQNYEDLFMTKSYVDCWVSGVSYKIGDAAVAREVIQPLKTNMLMIKRAQCYASQLKEKTNVRAVFV